MKSFGIFLAIFLLIMAQLCVIFSNGNILAVVVAIIPIVLAITILSAVRNI